MLDGPVSAQHPRRGEKQLRIAEHVVSTQQENATILLDVRRGEYYTLNRVGGRIWALLSEGTCPRAMVELLAEEFEVSAEDLSRDVQSFVEELHHSKLISD